MHWSRVNANPSICSVTNSVWANSLFNSSNECVFFFSYQCVFCSKGTYVLQDNNFQLLTQMSDGKQYTEDAPKVWKPFFLTFYFFNIALLIQFKDIQLNLTLTSNNTLLTNTELLYVS